MALQSVVDLLRPFAEFILPLIFFGFFAVAGVAIYYNRNRTVRRTFTVGLVVVLFLFQTTVIPLTVPPFTTWHKFSDTWDEERIEYEFRVVDEEGNELRFDGKSTLAFHGIRMSLLHDRMTGEFTEDERREAAKFLLHSAREYRTELERNNPRRGLAWTDGEIPPQQMIHFPSHGHVSTWTPSLVENYSEFVGIRLYQMTIETSEDGSEVVSYSEEMVYEYDDSTESNETVSETEPALEARHVH
ncbi:hypothetical protein SAMN04488063_2753 [Halopelagius inordinatus]|uniref:Uncharacterized protein n=1 Tax=Halopelagius inordinatus TaxID=553467 RepID=A0A1I2U2P8_9EURY|nr:hypothetical protein [Halopelagius inordinatus]SFG71412.1 hypothetical protein SAMN04488063_2753 [Halopelagius inordinatus]